MKPQRPDFFILSRVPSPMGTILLVSDPEERLRALDFEDFEHRMMRLLRLHYGERLDLRPGPAPASIAEPLAAYFAGQLSALDSIPVETGGTEFQRQVWAALRTIPVGSTTTYGALAAKLD